MILMEAQSSYWPSDSRCLTFDAGERLYWLVQRPAPAGWGVGRLVSSSDKQEGLFPLSSRYVHSLKLISPAATRGGRRRFLSPHAAPPADEQTNARAAEAAATAARPFFISASGSARERAYLFLEEQGSSTLALVWAIFIIVLIAVSVVVVIVQSMAFVHDRHGQMTHAVLWDALEFWITMVFSFEYVARLALTPESRCEHMQEPMNMVDVLAISPYYLQIISTAITGTTVDQAWMRVLRVARILRVLKLSKYSSGLQIFAAALSKAAPALAVQGLLMATMVIICSSLLFFCEQGDWDDHAQIWLREDGDASPFHSIPQTFWWAIVTMTTVGYGDKTPITPLGKGVAAVTMFIGVLSLAMPVSVVTSNFQEQYYIALARKRGRQSQPASVSTGPVTPAKDFRDRHLELKQTAMQLHSLLSRVQRVAIKVSDQLTPQLQRAKAARITQHRAEFDRKRAMERSQQRASSEPPSMTDPRSLPAPARLPPPQLTRKSSGQLAQLAGVVNLKRMAEIEAEVSRLVGVRSSRRPSSTVSRPTTDLL